MTLDDKQRKIMIICASGFFVCVLIALLIFLTVVVKPFRWNGLANSVQSVLNQAYGNQYIVGEPVFINSPLSFSAAAFRLSSGTVSRESRYGVILRITGFSGPVAAVFLYTPGTRPQLAGVAGMVSRQGSESFYGITQAHATFWEKKIPALIGEQTK